MEQIQFETTTQYLQTIIQFLDSIGIAVIEKQMDGNCFLPGLELGPNCIYVDYERCTQIGDILHEAGHIAVSKPELRPHIGQDNILELAGSSEWPTVGDEIITILWSYAAAVHLEIPINFIFHNEGYKNESDYIMNEFRNGNFIGMPLLVWRGMCNANEFPKMKKWLHP